MHLIKVDVLDVFHVCFFEKAFAVLLIPVSEKAGEHYQNLYLEAWYLESPAFSPGGEQMIHSSHQMKWLGVVRPDMEDSELS